MLLPRIGYPRHTWRIDMDQVSEHFRRREFACQCGCGFSAVDVELLHVLETVRQKFRRQVVVLSGCRCEQHNRDIGGAPHSLHLFGIAADISIAGISPRRVQEFLQDKFPDRYGLGSYGTWTHIDVRKQRARWRE